MTETVALDLFAGSGWGVACQWLGLEELGVEIMPEAVETRTANGMETIFNDVWDGLLVSEKITMVQQLMAPKEGKRTVHLSSPPCQTYSLAGNGAGRKAMNEVLEAIELHAYKEPEELIWFGEQHDPRTALVLASLAYIYRDMPDLVALEQVPQVLPVWEAYAEVMRGWGYDVKTAVLNAEQYGVPQTRKRAILVASRIGEVQLPTPTHSRYYSRTPEKLDAGVKKWVSMAEALGWDQPHPFPYFKANQLKHASIRPVTAPAPTITAGHSTGERGFIPASEGDARLPGGRLLSVDEAAILQTFPTPDFNFRGAKTKQFLQIGNAVPPVLAHAVLSALLAPSTAAKPKQIRRRRRTLL